MLVGCGSTASSVSSTEESASLSQSITSSIASSSVDVASITETDEELKSIFLNLYSKSEELEIWLAGNCLLPENIDSSLPTYPFDKEGYEDVSWVASSTYMTKEDLYSDFESAYTKELTQKELDDFFTPEINRFKTIDGRFYLINIAEYGRSPLVLDKSSITVVSKNSEKAVITCNISTPADIETVTYTLVKTSKGYRISSYS